MLHRLATLLASVTCCVAWNTRGYPWFDQWKATEYYRIPNGKLIPLPLRLLSHQYAFTGTADLAAVQASFTDEFYTPISVGGKAAVQIVLNNLTDTDCGNADTKNPYLETWIRTWVTPKDSPLVLPYDSDMSLLINSSKALVWMHRLILGDAPGVDTSKNDPALGALLGGRNVWGFPKHPVKAKIVTEYRDLDSVYFNARHLHRKPDGTEEFVDAITVEALLADRSAGNVVRSVVRRTADNATIGGPLYLVQQTLFGEGINMTEHIAPWSPKTDSLRIGTDDYYSSVIRAWKFEPKLKMSSYNTQIVLLKPSNWVKAPQTARPDLADSEPVLI
eukprot:gnl/TRDRNA2_/TRDRNA2_30064_c0_seq1.p1 gnl/TRDRNA2_/TRDRNA2_30064_c0~~gnl/TRDRNA2_/TRDRNA2_30064_c0_seq1.p1  ORF type:complete len:333 (-),score=36.25 gnl/TRDRNA2_/TRDRNA2_30064_c0_seq1:9-1007(-)